MALDDPNEMEFEDLNGQQAQEPSPVNELDDYEPEPVETPVEEHEDEEDYGKKVQKRIAKEVSKRKALEDKLAEQQAYIANLHKRMSGVEEHFATQQQQRTESEFNSKLTQLQESRRKAYEEGDLEAYDKLGDEILDTKLNAKAEELARRAAGNQPRSRQVQPQPVQAPQPPREQQGWLEQNKSWFNGDPNNAHKVQAANAMFDVLKAEGYDDTDPDIYQELDRRLTAAGIKAAARQRQRDPTAAPPNRYAGGKDSKRGFTDEDAAIMTKYGMNPRDPKERAAFIQDRDGTSVL